MTDPGSAPRLLMVTHVFPRHERDDVAPFLLRYGHELQAAGIEVRVVAPHGPGLPEEHDVAGVPVRRVRYGADEQETLAYHGDMHRRIRSPAGLGRLVALVRAMRSAVGDELVTFAPEVVDVQWLLPGMWFLPRAARERPLQVVVLGTDLALVDALPAGHRYARRLLARAESVVVMSEAAHQRLAALGRADAVVLPPPPNLPAAPLPAPPDTREILAIGRLVPEKGHADLLAAVAGLVPAARVTIVGTGPEAAALQAQAAAAGVDLTLRDPVAPGDLDAVFAACDVLAIPSHREGFCLVAQEAMLRDRAVVATAVGALPQQLAPVRDGITGWCVPAHDPEALRTALADALSDAGRRAAVAGRGRAAAEALLHVHRQRLAQLVQTLSQGARHAA